MKEKQNAVNELLRDGKVRIGSWLSPGLVSEVIAGSECDWILIDGELSPNDVLIDMAQLQAAGKMPVETFVRLPSNDASVIKQIMDIGARSQMIPNVRCTDQAREIVRTTHHAPDGIRNFSEGHRSNRFGRITVDQANAAGGQLLVLQIGWAESAKGAAEIAAAEGVNVLFVGLADRLTILGAMGIPGTAQVPSRSPYQGVLHAGGCRSGPGASGAWLGFFDEHH